MQQCYDVNTHVTKKFETKKTCNGKPPTTDLRYRSQVCCQLYTGLLWSMAVQIDTGVHCALLSKTTVVKNF